MENNQKYSNNEINLKGAAEGDEAAVENLIRDNYKLVVSIAGRFAGRGCELEDLIQIGLMGMLKAIRSFDLSRNTQFSTYAVPMIMGEIRKFLRDDGIIKISRIQKQNCRNVMRERENYIKEYGREPKISELSELTGLSADDISNALEISVPVISLSSYVGDSEDMTFENTLSVSDGSFENEIEKIALAESLDKMNTLWRKIIILRYFKSLSQTQTAEKLGLTQVKVSREEKKIINYLKNELGG